MEDNIDDIHIPHVIAGSANQLIRNLIFSVDKYGEDFTEPENSPSSGRINREFLNIQSILTNPRDRLFNSQIKPEIFNPSLAVAKFFYLLSGSNQIEDIAFYSNGARRYTDDGIIMPGAHGSRIFYPVVGIDQFEASAHLIREKKSSKRVTLAIYQPNDCGRKSQDIPCIVSIIFSPRNGKLHTTAYMRANDVYRILCYDLFELTMLAEFMAAYTDIELGYYYHIVTSMHLRGSDDISEAPKLVTEDVFSKSMPSMPKITAGCRLSLVQQEAGIRKKVGFFSISQIYNMIDKITQNNHPYWSDLLITLAIQGFFMTHSVEEVQELLNSLVLPSIFLVSNQHNEYMQKRFEIANKS
ncbi:MULTISPECIES: thymidylate synthase [Kamptonema]|uniref:thymidylate synthase n=1 Tax=Kamptonema TaxID=1501433 RepID=UPI0001DAD111|nr:MULTISPECIES: thymidylate synthase [Kamptonema]CBN58807.1 hypothetical protein OSCI_3890023 [Kamptonema sp. PCC 6506]